MKPRSKIPRETVQIDDIQIVLAGSPLKQCLSTGLQGFLAGFHFFFISSNLVAIALSSVRDCQVKTQISEWVE